MGIRFNTNTWRTPLRLIDCWLPPSPERIAPSRALPGSLLRFARAGWLGRNKFVAEPVFPTTAAQPVSGTPVRRACRVRLGSEGDALRPGVPAARVVISGRIDDVCDELARLADLELRAASLRC